MTDGRFHWYWGYGVEPEVMYGQEDTRDAILQVARLESDGAAFTIVEADKQVPDCNIFDAGRVLEDYDDHNEECWGEDGSEITPTREQELELESALGAVLKNWMDKHALHGKAWAFGVQRNREYFPAQEPTP